MSYRNTNMKLDGTKGGDETNQVSNIEGQSDAIITLPRKLEEFNKKGSDEKVDLDLESVIYLLEYREEVKGEPSGILEMLKDNTVFSEKYILSELKNIKDIHEKQEVKNHSFDSDLSSFYSRENDSFIVNVSEPYKKALEFFYKYGSDSCKRIELLSKLKADKICEKLMPNGSDDDEQFYNSLEKIIFPKNVSDFDKRSALKAALRYAIRREEDRILKIKIDEIKIDEIKVDIKALASKDDIKALASKDDIKALASKDDIKALAGSVQMIRNLLELQTDILNKSTELNNNTNIKIDTFFRYSIPAFAFAFIFILVVWFGTYVGKNSWCTFSPDTSFCQKETLTKSVENSTNGK